MPRLASHEFLTLSHAELARAQQRVRAPEWSAAAALLARDAAAAAQRWTTLPAFDSGWYDADPGRDFSQTYNQFAAYAYPGTHLLGDAKKMILADAVLGQNVHTPSALAWTCDFLRRFSFHPQHHDAGLNYANILHALGDILAYAGHLLSDADRGNAVAQLESAGEAFRRNTQHWLTNLAHMPYNNHFAHHRSGLLTVALLLDRADWTDEALNGPRSFGELLVGATTDDGWCYESSTVYHFVTLRGLLETAQLVAYHPQLRRDFFRETFANGRTLKQMFDAPLHMMLPNGELPPVGDCYYYRQPLWEMRAGLYELAYGVYGDPRYAWILQRAGERRSLEALLHGVDHIGSAQPPEISTRLWPEHGWALLTSHTENDYWNKEPVTAFVTSDLSGIHHHQDTLSLQLAVGNRIWLEDVESRAVELQGFAAPIQSAFNRTLLPHNLVAVDLQDQADNPAVLPPVEFKSVPGCATLSIGDALGILTPGVRRLRNVAVTPDYCLDIYQVAGEVEHIFDWLLHPRTDRPATCENLTFSPTRLSGNTPYSVLRNPEAAPVPAAGATLQFHQTGAALHCHVTAHTPAQLIRAQWPTQSDSAGDWRNMFILRLTAKEANFVALYQPASEANLWRISKTDRHFNGLFHELRLEITNQKETRRHWLKSL